LEGQLWPLRDLRMKRMKKEEEEEEEERERCQGSPSRAAGHFFVGAKKGPKKSPWGVAWPLSS